MKEYIEAPRKPIRCGAGNKCEVMTLDDLLEPPHGNQGVNRFPANTAKRTLYDNASLRILRKTSNVLAEVNRGNHLARQFLT